MYRSVDTGTRGLEPDLAENAAEPVRNSRKRETLTKDKQPTEQVASCKLQVTQEQGNKHTLVLHLFFLIMFSTLYIFLNQPHWLHIKALYKMNHIHNRRFGLWRNQPVSNEYSITPSPSHKVVMS